MKNACQHLSEEPLNVKQAAEEDEQPERLLHTYAVLVVDVVDLVDAQSLPLVQLLLLNVNERL